MRRQPTAPATYSKSSRQGHRLTPAGQKILASFSVGIPVGSPVADAAGDLFVTTTLNDLAGDGAIFEIVKTGNTFSAPEMLAPLESNIQDFGPGGLIMDAQGDLFGASTSGGNNAGDGYVFELKKNGGVYDSSSTILALFNGVGDGLSPEGPLVADSAGDLFGTTSGGGHDGDGVVFEITKNGSSYNAVPKVLASFTDSLSPSTNLSIDAVGDLFLTRQGGFNTGTLQNDDGQVFEIAKSGGVYGALTQLASFDGLDGSNPLTGVFADPAGNLFGTTTAGGAHGDGTVFEITGSGFVPVTPTKIGGGAVTPTPGPSRHAIGTDGGSDILFQNTSGQVSIWDMDGSTRIGSGAVSPNPGPSWRAIGLT